MASDEQERSVKEHADRKGYKDLFKAKGLIPMQNRVKCRATRAVKEAQNKMKLRRDYKLSELAYKYDKLFGAYVKRKDKNTSTNLRSEGDF